MPWPLTDLLDRQPVLAEEPIDVEPRDFAFVQFGMGGEKASSHQLPRRFGQLKSLG